MGRAIVIFDNIDPPREHQEFFGIKGVKRVFVNFLWTFLELLALKNTKMILLTGSWKKYYVERYGAKPQDIIVLPCGSFSEGFDHIKNKEPKRAKSSFIAFYAGAATKAKNIDKLIDIIDDLVSHGLDIKLKISGHFGHDMATLSTEHSKEIGASGFSDFASQLLDSDVMVIPYTAFYYSLTSLAKVGDYMMAGKPLVSTSLLETSRLIEESGCGYIAKDFREFKEILENLYNNRNLVAELGRRAEQYAEAHLDYVMLARSLFDEIFSPWCFNHCFGKFTRAGQNH